MSIATDDEALAAARELERLAEAEYAAHAAVLNRLEPALALAALARLTPLAAAAVRARLDPRQRALISGSNRYNTGKPCAQGHASDRYVRDYRCVACVRMKENSEQRRMRKARRRKAKARRLGWAKVK